MGLVETPDTLQSGALLLLLGLVGWGVSQLGLSAASVARQNAVSSGLLAAAAMLHRFTIRMHGDGVVERGYARLLDTWASPNGHGQLPSEFVWTAACGIVVPLVLFAMAVRAATRTTPTALDRAVTWLEERVARPPPRPVWLRAWLDEDASDSDAHVTSPAPRG